VLNEPPVASLAQLVSSGSAAPDLSVERAAAAVLVSFERIWNSFLQQEEQCFQPFMDQYLRSWLHSYVMLFSPNAEHLVMASGQRSACYTRD
jgi:biotin--protein ligase